MATYIISVKATPDPGVINLRVSKIGAGVTEDYDAPASVTTDDKVVMNLVRLARLGAGIVPIKPK